MAHVPDPRRAYVSLLVVQLLFGLFPVAVKKVVHDDGTALFPLGLLSIRVAGAALCLLALHGALARNKVPLRREFPRLALLSLLGVVLNMGLFLFGLSQTAPVEAVLVITTIPVFTYALAVVLKRETLGPWRAVGIALALLGVVSLIYGSYRDHLADPSHPNRALGDLLIVANCLCFAGFLVLGKPMMDQYDPLSVTTWMFALGAVVVLPVGLASGLRGSLASLQPSSWAWLAFIVVGPSVLTYLLNARALRHVHASTVAAFTYVQPIFTAVAAYALLHEGLHWSIVPAAALVFAGLWLVARREPRVLEGAIVGE